MTMTIMMAVNDDNDDTRKWEGWMRPSILATTMAMTMTAAMTTAMATAMTTAMTTAMAMTTAITLKVTVIPDSQRAGWSRDLEICKSMSPHQSVSPPAFVFVVGCICNCVCIWICTCTHGCIVCTNSFPITTFKVAIFIISTFQVSSFIISI